MEIGTIWFIMRYLRLPSAVVTKLDTPAFNQMKKLAAFWLIFISAISFGYSQTATLKGTLRDTTEKKNLENR